MTHSAYLMGIGGIGMANVAVVLKQAGYDVSGSDENIYEPAATILQEQNIEVFTPYAADNLPDNTPIIVGNAQSRGHVEVEAALNRHFPLFSFPEFLARNVLANRHSIVVAGTHGKSTTTACIAHLLSTVGAKPGYLIGAMPLNMPAGGEIGAGDYFVIEGDEYDSAFFDKRSKFLHYFPRTLVLGPVEYDHADIFPDLDSLLLSFRRLINLLPQNGSLIYDATSSLSCELAAMALCKTIAVGVDNGDFQLADHATSLRFQDLNGRRYDMPFSILGLHNRKNALLALAAVHVLGFEIESCRAAISSFQGNRRRMERLHMRDGLIVYDDFAHHPTAIAAALDAVRESHAGHRVIAVVEPRSNTMVRNTFQRELPQALARADHVIIGDIHRLEKIPPEQRLDFTRISSELRAAGRTMIHMSTREIPGQLVKLINGQPTVVLFYE